MTTARNWLSALLVGATLALPAAARADEVRVMISGGFSAAYKQLVPQFEQATGHKVLTAYGPSMGTTENAIPVRLARGEPVDVLIMVGEALTGLTEQGKADKASRVCLFCAAEPECNWSREKKNMTIRA